MKNDTEIYATVRSPSKGLQWRRGKGFSLEEIKQSGKNLTQLKEVNVHIDYFRKTVYQENIETLNSLKIVEKEREKRKPFVAKEKKRTPFKPKKEKPKRIARKDIEKAPKERKEKVKPVKKTKPKSKKAKKKITEKKGTPLTELPGVGPATAVKFKELGVNNVEELCKENPEELGLLINGVSVDRCKDWIEEGKELIK